MNKIYCFEYDCVHNLAGVCQAERVSLVPYKKYMACATKVKKEKFIETLDLEDI